MPKSSLAELVTRRAEKLVRDEGLTTLPIDPKVLAAARGIEVMAKPAEAKGVSGMLISVPGTNKFVIAYATHINNEGFQRFSIAHERTTGASGTRCCRRAGRRRSRPGLTRRRPEWRPRRSSAQRPTGNASATRSSVAS